MDQVYGAANLNIYYPSDIRISLGSKHHALLVSLIG